VTLSPPAFRLALDQPLAKPPHVLRFSVNCQWPPVYLPRWQETFKSALITVRFRNSLRRCMLRCAVSKDVHLLDCMKPTITAFSRLQIMIIATIVRAFYISLSHGRLAGDRSVGQAFPFSCEFVLHHLALCSCTLQNEQYLTSKETLEQNAQRRPLRRYRFYLASQAVLPPS
jgi:hypothetical protein